MAQVAVVRYGTMEKADVFSTPDEPIHAGADVVVRTQRGVEWGRVVTLRDEPEGGRRPSGEVLRKAVSADHEKRKEIVDVQEVEEFRCCRDLIKKNGLPMNLVQVEHLFGGNKIIFYFLAEGRVDFRELVRDLAKEYRTRIEMRQIGVRDEARLMGLIGPCGNELCCRTFLKALKPVPMKLAKDQKSTLDPAKISGCCGRLKCCLRFEEDLYKELRRNLPRRGAKVTTPEGEGTVVNFEVIGQTVDVDLGGGNRQRFPANAVSVAEEQ
jgi:cell fate regulator YaaT (PSP1 superfamily)